MMLEKLVGMRTDAGPVCVCVCEWGVVGKCRGLEVNSER